MRVVVRESAWVSPEQGGGRTRVDTVVLTPVAATAPPWWRGKGSIVMTVKFNEKTEEVHFSARVEGELWFYGVAFQSLDFDGTGGLVAAGFDGDRSAQTSESRALVVDALQRSMLKTAKQEVRKNKLRLKVQWKT